MLTRKDERILILVQNCRVGKTVSFEDKKFVGVFGLI